jgi:hypothetical protein
MERKGHNRYAKKKVSCMRLPPKSMQHRPRNGMQSEAGRQTARRAAFFHLKQAGVKAAHFRVAAHVGAVFAVQLK